MSVATRERLTVSNVAIQLVNRLGGYGSAMIFVESTAIRYTTDGTDPVAGVAGDVNAKGAIIAAGGGLLIDQVEIKNIKFIRNTGSDAVLEVQYK